MSDFKTRLIEEKKELDEKLSKLEPFILSENFYKINEKQQSLLHIQLYAMKTYSVVLDERIDDLTEKLVIN